MTAFVVEGGTKVLDLLSDIINAFLNECTDGVERSRSQRQGVMLGMHLADKAVAIPGQFASEIVEHGLGSRKKVLLVAKLFCNVQR